MPRFTVFNPIVFSSGTLFLAVVLGFTASGLLVAQGSRDRAVEITATVQESPPQINLAWNATSFPLSEQKIYRRLKEDAAWSQIATPAISATTFSDTSVTLGGSYEYWIYRVFPDLPSTACGYIRAGICAPFMAERGRLILLVDSTMASPLAAELNQWQSDLTGDGWTVIRQIVSRTATPPSIRAIIQGLYAANPAETKGLILFGHIPVAYSGDFAADGHLEHYGAWPADVYYADIDGNWTDTTINDDGAVYQNQNIPGDGKFDQSVLPSDVELQTGRIDLANLPAFNLTETELLRQYLNRNHAYRYKLGNFSNIPRRALMDDNFGFFSGDAFATDAWRAFTPLCGVGNVMEADWFTTLQSQSYLWAYGCGGGGPTSANGIGTTADFAAKDSRAVFNLLFGSWFGDWNNEDNFLRAPLAGRPGSLGLVSCFASRPRWVFHPMALGETIGHCAKLSQNNAYRPLRGYDSNNTERFVLTALHGDPTLRLYPVSPPTNLTATPTQNLITLTWGASSDVSIVGYMIYRATAAGGPYVRLSGVLEAGTNFTDTAVAANGIYSYMVRAVKLETSASGTFLNPSQGIFSSLTTASAASTAEMNVNGAGNPIMAGETIPMASSDTHFGDVELAQARVSKTFTITNPGNATLTLSAPQIRGPEDANFWIESPPSTNLASGASTTFRVLFMPSALGLRNATVTLTSNDPDEGTFQFAISGNCIAPPAVLALYPPAISRAINPATVTNETLRIANPGSATLTHTLSSSLGRYHYRDSDSFAGPTYAWQEIAGTGTRIAWSSLDDALSTPLALGFVFPFYGNTYSSVRVCTNGFLTFTGRISYGANSILPNLSASENMIAAFWNDIVVDASSGVFYQNINGNFVVQFENLPLYANANTRITCQAILKPTGEIFLQYKALAQTGNNYTIGIQNSNRDDGLLIAHNAPYVRPGLAVRITPPRSISWLNLGATSGTLTAGGTQEVPLTLNSTNLSPGDYYAEIIVDSNVTTHTPAIIPVRLTIGNTPIQNWRQTYFQTTTEGGDAADSRNPDADGRSNLLEYAFASDPLVNDSVSSPPMSIHSSGYLQVQFTRHAARTDLRYIVEATTDLASPWTALATSIHGAPTRAMAAFSVTESGSGELKTVTVQDSDPAASFPRRFVRLSILRD